MSYLLLYRTNLFSPLDKIIQMSYCLVKCGVMRLINQMAENKIVFDARLIYLYTLYIITTQFFYNNS